MPQSSDPTLLSASLRMIWGLLIVSGILLIIYGLMKKKLPFGQRDSKSRIKIKEIRHLMPKKSLCLIEIDGKEFLLGLGTESVSLITELEENKSHKIFRDDLENAENKELES